MLLIVWGNNVTYEHFSNTYLSQCFSTAHFLFPVLGRSNVASMYGYRFIPLVEVPSVYYITKKTNDVTTHVITSCLSMWPMVIICLLMVAISGTSYRTNIRRTNFSFTKILSDNVSDSSRKMTFYAKSSWCPSCNFEFYHKSHFTLLEQTFAISKCLKMHNHGKNFAWKSEKFAIKFVPSSAKNLAKTRCKTEQ